MSPGEQPSSAAPSPFPPIADRVMIGESRALVNAAMRLVVEDRLAEFS